MFLVDVENNLNDYSLSEENSTIAEVVVKTVVAIMQQMNMSKKCEKNENMEKKKAEFHHSENVFNNKRGYN